MMSGLFLSQEGTSVSIVPFGDDSILPLDQGDIYAEDNKTLVLYARDCTHLVTDSGIPFELAKKTVKRDARRTVLKAVERMGMVPNWKDEEYWAAEVEGEYEKIRERARKKLDKIISTKPFEDRDAWLHENYELEFTRNHHHFEAVIAIEEDLKLVDEGKIEEAKKKIYCNGKGWDECIANLREWLKKKQRDLEVSDWHLREINKRIEENDLALDAFLCNQPYPLPTFEEIYRQELKAAGYADDDPGKYDPAVHVRPEMVWGYIDRWEYMSNNLMKEGGLGFEVASLVHNGEEWEQGTFGIWRLDEPHRGRNYLVTHKKEAEIGFYPAEDGWVLTAINNPQNKIVVVGTPEEVLALGGQGIAAVFVIAVEWGRADYVSAMQLEPFRGRTFQFAFDNEWYQQPERLAAILKLQKMIEGVGGTVEVVQFGALFKNVAMTVVGQGGSALAERLNNPTPGELFFMRYSAKLDTIRALKTKQGQIDAFIREIYAPMLALDAFSLEIRQHGQPVEIGRLAAEMSELLGFNVRPEGLYHVVLEVASQRLYNRVRDYLVEVAQKHEFGARSAEILEYLVKEAIGISDPIEARYIIKWLVAASARSFEPGCKVDTALVLVGRQGLFKTTFFEALAGKENFASVSGDVNDRKFLMTMRKYWISELGEIDAAFRSNDWGRLKDFLSKSVDSYVPPYGTKAMEFPRIGVLAGSTNYEKPLRDVGGEFRRYWCVRIEKPIDIAWVKEHRDEIWAAATHLYHAGFQWWLNEEEVAAHAIHAQQFAAESSLYEKLLEILPTTRTFKVGDGKVTVKWTEDIFAISSLISEMGVTGRASEMTIASDLKRLGFEKKQARGYLGKTQYWYLKDPATFNGVASTVDVMPNEIRLMLKPAE